MSLMPQKILWKDKKSIERSKDYLETQLQTELGIDVGQLASQEEFIEILDYAGTN